MFTRLQAILIREQRALVVDHAVLGVVTLVIGSVLLAIVR